MAKYRDQLPQLEELFLADGGVESTLIFREGFDLPEFAAFDLLNREDGAAALEKYYRGYMEMAHRYGANFVLESCTWRANADWGAKLGYDSDALADLNRRSVDMLAAIRDEFAAGRAKTVISGAIGPRGDGYVPNDQMTIPEAAEYHAPQIETFSQTDADLVIAYTFNYVDEAVGAAQAARGHNIPAAISFTVETDGRLPTGQPLGEAIEQVDDATGRSVAYFMINCAHTTHFMDTLASGGAWVKRIGGLRPNASKLSHAELEALDEIDDGDPQEFGSEYRQLRDQFGHINMLGGCCGTDQRHIEELCRTCFGGE